MLSNIDDLIFIIYLLQEIGAPPVYMHNVCVSIQIIIKISISDMDKQIMINTVREQLNTIISVLKNIEENNKWDFLELKIKLYTYTEYDIIKIIKNIKNNKGSLTLFHQY